jgi:hypothetical protein
VKSKATLNKDAFGKLNTHQQCELVAIWLILYVFPNITMLVIPGHKTGCLRSVEIEDNAQQWSDIRVIECGPDAHFADEFLKT